MNRLAGRCRVAIDLRRVPEGGGLARYATQITSALAARSDLDVVELTPPAGRRELAREQLDLPRSLRRLRADVLLSPANRGLPLFSPCPSVLVLHDVTEWDRTLVPPFRGAAAARFAYANAISLAGATRILTDSRYSAGRIRARLGISEGRLRVVHLGAAAPFFAGADPRACERLGLAPGFILHVGGQEARKDLPTVLRALGRPGPGGPELVLVGAAHSHLPPGVRALGWVGDDDLAALYAGAACLVSAGLDEGFGLPVVEAMAAGCPVVAAAAGALPEVLEDGGQLFPPGDDAALAGLLRELLSSPRSAERWRSAASARGARFTWERAAGETAAVLQEAAALPRGQRVSEGLQSLPALPRWIR